MKKNCWEYKQCGRQPGGANAEQLGICPVCTEERLDKTNGGSNGGRACWALAGTLCGGSVQGSFVEKVGNCVKCDFYRDVRTEEGDSLVKVPDILKKLR